jgi:hypothetical protein
LRSLRLSQRVDCAEAAAYDRVHHPTRNLLDYVPLHHRPHGPLRVIGAMRRIEMPKQTDGLTVTNSYEQYRCAIDSTTLLVGDKRVGRRLHEVYCNRA